MWDTKTGTIISQLENYSYCSTFTPRTQAPPPECLENYTAIAFSHNGNTIATSHCSQYSNFGCSQAHIRLWDKISNKFLGQSVFNQASLPVNLVFSPDGKLLASSNSDGTMDLRDVISGVIVGQFKTGHIEPPPGSGGPESGPIGGTSQGEDLAFSPNGKMQKRFTYTPRAPEGTPAWQAIT